MTGIEYKEKKKMTELKPCPFCGGKETELKQFVGWWSVNCYKGWCFAKSAKTQEEAIENWNRRAEDGK